MQHNKESDDKNKTNHCLQGVSQQRECQKTTSGLQSLVLPVLYHIGEP